MAEILSAEEWTRFFGALCRDDGLDDVYNAEEKLQLHDVALRVRLAYTEAERDALQASLTEVDLVWVPRIADAEARAERAESALRKYGEHHTTCDAWPYDEWQMNEGPCTCGLDEAARAALGEQEGGER